METSVKITPANLPIIGAICGDILGSCYEGDPVKYLDHPLLLRDATCTDDSVCTIAVAEAILTDNDFSRSLRSWCRKYPRAGYGRIFRHWFRSENNQPYNSWGNGAAMRVSAVGALAKSLDEALSTAEKSAAVTHNHPEGIKGAQATSAAIYLAKTGKSKEEIRAYIETEFGYDLSRKYDDIQPGYRFDVSCQGSVPESLICFLESQDYEDTIRHAIAMGGDADTMAAIAGGVAAAYYKEIPAQILQHCVSKMPNDFIEVLNSVEID